MRNIPQMLVLGLMALAPLSHAETTVQIDAGKRGASIGDVHYGIFFEEINHAGDGGLYAELVRNRSFEDSDTDPEYWTAVGGAKLALTSADLLEGNAHALEVSFSGAGDGFANPGYWGIDAVDGREYALSFYVRGNWSGTLTAALVSADGRLLGTTDIAVKSTAKWQKVTASITATGAAADASLRITASKAGTLAFDCVSLFPPTYKNRPNGCRIDLAEKLEAMKPGFMRFPGGCFVEGTESATGHNRFEWKKTVGPIENRPGHWNVNWGYRVTDGLGFHEMLQLAEDLGAEPLYVVNIGMGHGWTENYLAIDDYIQEALDAIEYCNGPADSGWGAVRAANGHPEPFNLRLLEIGNENYQADASQQSDHYAERYKQFYDAIKARYPEITLIGNVEAWGTDNPSWRNSYPCEVVDEHYYRTPAWFENQYAKYDNYDRSKPRVYVGEYAVTDGYGTNGHLTAALGEAVYMLGMENNADVCVMNSYAPIFVNENDKRWLPDMIRFDSHNSYGTPSYHVQQLMATLHGKQNVKWTETGNTVSTGHGIGLSTWSTCATYDNVKVSAADGTVLFSDDFSNSRGWTSAGGSWSVDGGVLSQTDASMQGKLYVSDFQTPDSYVLEVDATKKSGSEAFLVAFNYGDASNYCWWNIGGWSNSRHAIEVCSGGAKTEYGGVSGSIETGRTYHLRIEVNGPAVKCYIDGELIHDVTLPGKRKAYYAASVDDAEGMLYIKAVNTEAEPQQVRFGISNASFDGLVDVTVLTSAAGTDENDTDTPDRVVPSSGTLDNIDAASATYTVPAYSLSIIRIRLSDVQLGSAGSTPSEDEEADLLEALKPLKLKLANLHASAELPAGTTTGAAVKWSFVPAQGGLTLTEGRWSSQLTVPSPLTNTSAMNAGTLTANVTYPSGAVASYDFPVTLAATDGMYGYLYCYMKSSKEITNFALGSKEEGAKVFHELLGGEEVFDTKALAEIEHGTRDAYIGRGERADEYFITTTDMCNATSNVWNNYGLNMLRSSDLIHWEGTTFDFRKGKTIFSDPTATTDAYRTDAEYAKIRRVWAPQWIWDPTADGGKGAYLVYYSLLSSNSGDDHDRIFYSYADKDFKTLTQPRIFYDPGYSVIDADIVYNPYDGLYHMCIKHETATGTNRGVYILTSDRLVGGEWTEYLHVTNEGSELTEGATLMRRIDEDVYNLYYMRYTGGNAYKVCELDHLCDNFGAATAVGGTGSFQHGSVMSVTEEEYTVLQSWSDLLQLIADAEATSTHAYDDALANARQALNYRTVSTLAEKLPEAVQMLKAAKEDYVKELISPDGVSDLTSLLSNPAFTSGGAGWNGTSFTAASAGVAEHWNKTFYTWQELEYMPAGYYVLSCSGFYRYGGREGYAEHVAGTEKILANLYINDAETPFTSLFDDATPYTNSPYTFPDNVSQANSAFNTDRQYADNYVAYHLEQTGTLRVGIRKSEAKGSDWTCFDNFHLYYSNDATGVEPVAVEQGANVDVYTTTGILLRKNVPVADATAGLAPGFYIVGGRKVSVR